MKFLANENFPFPSLMILRAKGFEVVSIAEDSPSWSDIQVMDRAVQEDLVILTFDRDYGELIFHHKREAPPAVVYFRFKGQDPESAAKIFLERIEIENLQIKNYFTVIEEAATRQRRLR